MSKTPTNWSNNDVKVANSWATATKNADSWAPSGLKNTTQYTVSGKQKDAWGPTQHATQAYQYDSPDMTYDSNLWFYNSLVNNNTANQLFVTKWSAN
jgi:hypothetical protein